MNNNKIIKSILFFIIITIYTLLFIYNIYLLNNIRFNWIIVDNDKYNSIIETRSEYQDDMISKIEFNGNELFDVSDTNEFFYSMVVKDFNKYNPYIKYKSDLKDTNIVLNKRITDELISNNDHIKLLVYNDDYYKEYEIVVTTLPIMNISYEDNEENNKKLNYSFEEMHDDDLEHNVYGSLHLFDNNASENTESNIRFHLKGATSLSDPKKNYKLSLRNEEDKSVDKNLLDMRYDDDWILYSGYKDEDFIRNQFSSKIWYDIFSDDNVYGKKAGNYYKNVELFINGSYSGLYSLGFPIDSKQLGLDSEEYLYKKNGGFIENELFDEDNNDDIISWTVKSSDKKHEANKVFKKYFNRLNSSNDITELSSFHDIDNIMDFTIFSMFTQNVDNWKQLYISLRNNDDDYKAIYIPWDLDLTFGNMWDDKTYNSVSQYGLDVNNNGINYAMSPFVYMTNINAKETYTLLKEKYDDMVNDKFTLQYLMSIIDEYESDVFGSGVYLRDKVVYPDSSFKTGTRNLNKFREYVEKRYNSLHNYINFGFVE